MRVRPAELRDVDAIAVQRAQLWPDGSYEEHRAEALAALSGQAVSTLPAATFVAEEARGIIGFVDVGLRSHADGCDPARPVGFLEGWFVAVDARRRGVGRALFEAAERWCRAQGCTEMASDTWIEQHESIAAHGALGFEVVDRCVNFKKTIAAERSATDGAGIYDAVLARLHHLHFGMVARAAARELVARLDRAEIRAGQVIDLATGSGILPRALGEAGFEVTGVDLSPAMLVLARDEAPRARFVEGSLWSFELSSCVAVSAVGEAFNYAADPKAGLAALEERFLAICRALAPGGLFLFDVAGPGRSGPSAERRGFWAVDAGHIGLVERERAGELARAITVFAPKGDGSYSRSEETHTLRTYDAAAIERLLRAAGFSPERLSAYDDFRFPPGWVGFAAVKITN